MINFSHRLNRAVELGTQAHAGMVWNGGMPYTAHLQSVDDQLVKYLSHKVPETVLAWLRAAAWLHDAVEDTGMSLDTIEKECGQEVRTLVWAVTDELGKNRAERHQKTYPKIKNVAYAVALKLADRISNVEASLLRRGQHFDMYKSEHAEFKAALYTPGVYEEMWTHLDDLLADGPSKQAAKIADKVSANIRAILYTEEGILLKEDLYSKIHKENTKIIQAELNKEK